MDKATVKKQILSFRSSEGIDFDADANILCEQLHTKSQRVFTLNDPKVPLLPARERKDTLKYIEIDILELRKLMEEVDPLKAYSLYRN